jgi:predicted TIM-barrel fold metal-dependent hydrolase
MNRPQSRAPNAPTRPSFVLPRGACDTHVHVLGPYSRYPLDDRRPYDAPEQPVENLRHYLDTMGLDRVVIAHIYAHGTDMRVTLDALAVLGDRARGVATLKPDATGDDIAELDSRGMRGIRMAPLFGYAMNRETLKRVNALAAPHNWHILSWVRGPDELELIQSAVGKDVTVPIVLDHLGNPCWKPSAGLEQRGFKLLQDVLRTGQVWLRLSALYRTSAQGWPWPELTPYGAALAEEFPDRLLWASDWPHVGPWEGEMMNSGEMIDWLREIGCNQDTLERILVHNPARLYRF